VIERPKPPSQPYSLRRAAERAAADGVDWWTMRIVASDLIPDGLADVRYRWTFADTVEGHMALDVLEEAREQRRREAEVNRGP